MLKVRYTWAAFSPRGRQHLFTCAPVKTVEPAVLSLCGAARSSFECNLVGKRPKCERCASMQKPKEVSAP